MKELSIEKKAKRYDKAIERAEGLIDFCSDSELKTLEYVFPELKESKDEKIKKVIYGWIYTQPSQFFDSGFSKEEMLAWIEKQGEQKATIEMKSAEESLGIDSNTYNKIVDECIYDEQKPTGEVEPKFKVGDIVQYITDSTDRRRIEDVDELCNMYHTDSSPIMFEIEDEWKVVVHAEDVEDDSTEFEKKELKKISNALEECEIEHIEHGKYYYCIKDYYSGGNKRASKGEVVRALRGMNMMDLGVKANEYFIPVKCIIDRSAWSEEDERMYRGLHNLIYSTPYCDSRKEFSDWLKSLKGGVQPKQEWSEDDIVAIDCAVDVLNKDLPTLATSIKRLKSLRPQNRWKPSDEQIEALKGVVQEGVFRFGILESLYQDLKKLREE